MAKITRKLATIFGGSETAAPGGIGVFGSLSGGTPAYSLDPAVIQAAASWLTGWGAAVVGNFPALEDMNSVDYVNSYQIAYLMQQGIAEYNSATTYYTNSICSSGALLYISLVDSNIGNAPASSPTQWSIFSGTSGKGLNVIRNSGMAVAQRGTSGTVTAATPTYTIDGWIVTSTGANVTWSQALGPVNNAYALKLVSAGSVSDLTVKQRIESVLMQEIGYGLVTIQAYVYNGTLGTITPTLTLNIPTVADNYGSVTNVLAATNLQSIPAGTGATVAYVFNITSAQAYQNGLEAIWDFGAVANTKFIEMGLVDISPTPNFTVGLINNPPLPSVRQIAEEFLICQRYYLSFIFGNSFFGSAYSTTQAGFVIAFPSTMRGTPTPSIPIFSDILLVRISTGGTTASTSIFLSTNSVNSCYLQMAVASGLTSGEPYYLFVNTGGTINFSAEL